MPDPVTDGPVDPLVEDERGFTTSKMWAIDAASVVDARNLLYQYRSVRRGTIFATPQGEVPDLRLRVQTLTVEPEVREASPGGTARYIARADYATNERNIAEPVVGSAPAYNWSGSLTSQAVDVDINGAAIVNSAAEPYDPPIQGDLPLLALSVEWYVGAFSVSTMVAYSGALNSTAWTVGDGSGVLAAGQARVNSLGRQPIEEALIRIQAEIELRPFLTLPSGTQVSGFDHTLADRGRRHIDPDNSPDADGNAVYIQFTDGKGKPLTEPRFLDGAGQPLAADAATAYNTFRIHPAQPFAALGI